MLVGFLVYTRWIVGSCVERIQKGNSREDEGFQHLISSIQDEKQEFLYESFVQNKEKFVPWYQANEKDGRITSKKKKNPESWLGKFALRPECMSRFLMWSSFQDGFFQLVFRFWVAHSFYLTYISLVELFTATAREANGQMLWYRILQKWRLDRFQDRDTGSFRAALKEHNNLYVLYCCECLYINSGRKDKNGNETVRKNATTCPRYQNCKAMLYMKEDDRELVNDIVSWSLDLLEHI